MVTSNRLFEYHSDTKPLEKMSFEELMHLWRYSSLKHQHFEDEPKFWAIVKKRACEAQEKK